MTDSAPPNPSLAQFASYIETIPPRLGLWRTATQDEQWPLIAWLNVLAVQEMRETAREVGPLMAARLRHAELHNAVGLGVRWLLTYLPRQSIQSGSQDMERKGFAKWAGEVWSMRDLVNAARSGVYSFHAENHQLFFDFSGDVELEALDNMLDLVDDLWRTERLKQAVQEGEMLEQAPPPNPRTQQQN